MNMNKRSRAKSRPSGDLTSSGRSLAAPHRIGRDEGNEGKQQQENEGGGDESPTPSEGIVVRPKRRSKKETQPRSVSVPAGLVVPEKSVEQSCNLSLSSSHSGDLASSDRSAAAPYQKSGDEGKQQQQEEDKGRDVLPTHSEGIDVRLKQQPKKEKQRLSRRRVEMWIPVGGVVREKSCVNRQQQQQHCKPSSCSGFLKEVGGASADPPTSRKKKDKDVQYKKQKKKSSSSQSTRSCVAATYVGRLKQPLHWKHICVVCAPPREKESVKHAVPFEKKGSLVRSVETQEESSFDQEETNSCSKLEMLQPEPPSGDSDLTKIAQDNDAHSGKKPSWDLSKIIALDEDEQYPDEIGVPAIQDHKQEQEARRLAQYLLGMDVEAISKMISDYVDLLKFDPPDGHDSWLKHTPEQLTELYQRLAFYRIRGYELSVDRQLPELDNAYLEGRFSPASLLDNGYFKYYEEELEWYFDPELFWHACYDDYQRLVLCNFGEYRDWDQYHLIRNTYEQDLAYVQYCDAIATNTKWFEDYLVDRPIQWEKIENVALIQALMVAEHVHNVPISLLCSGLREHLWSVRFDHFNYKGMDGVYFEIWKRVSKQNMDFTNALSEIHRQNMFPSRNMDIEHELKNNLTFSMKDKYDAHVACIDETVSEDQALLLIKEAVTKMCPKSKTYVDYARKKLDIAKDIGLVPKGAILEVREQCLGDNGQTKLAMDNQEGKIPRN